MKSRVLVQVVILSLAIASTAYTAPVAPNFTNTTQILAGGAFLGGRYILLGKSGTILTSPDGKDWTPETSGSSAYLSGIAGNGTRVVAIGDGGTVLYSDAAGVWKKPATPPATTLALSEVVWSGKLFVVVGDSGCIFSSPDGSVWTRRDTKWPGYLTKGFLTKVNYSEGKFLAVGRVSFVRVDSSYSIKTAIVLRSEDGITWTPVNTPTPCDMVTLARADTEYVVTGICPDGSPVVLKSKDGLVWKSNGLRSPMRHMNSISWRNGVFYGVASEVTAGLALYSNDGISWTPLATSKALYHQFWNGSVWMVVGNGVIGMANQDQISIIPAPAKKMRIGGVRGAHRGTIHTQAGWYRANGVHLPN